jgi:twitching motility two-component system response regulator PilH
MSSILIVEDSPTVLHIVKERLEKVGYEVLEATDGEQALQIASAEKPGLILLDVILPKINGYQVCRKLKAQPYTNAIPVIMLTSKAKDTDRLWGLEQGADAYITKPIDADELLSVIGQFLPLPE